MNLEYLENLLQQIDELPLNNYNSSQAVKIKTKEALLFLFPEEIENSKAVMKIDFSPRFGPANESDYARAYRSGQSILKSVIESKIDVLKSNPKRSYYYPSLIDKLKSGLVLGLLGVILGGYLPFGVWIYDIGKDAGAVKFDTEKLNLYKENDSLRKSNSILKLRNDSAVKELTKSKPATLK